MSIKNKLKIGLVASTGSLNTFSTLGIVNFIKEHNIKITGCSASSGGSFPLAAFCAGIDLRAFDSEKIARDLKDCFFDTDKKSLIKLLLGFLAHVMGINIKSPLMGLEAMGYYKGDGLLNLLKEKLGNLTFKDTIIPIYVPAWNITEKQTDLFHKHGLNPTLAEAVRMSSTIPGVFQPYKYNGHLYWDGGVARSLPVMELLQNEPDINFVILIDTISGNDLIMDPLKKPMSLLHALNDIVIGLQNVQVKEAISYAISKLGEENVLILTPPHRWGWSDFDKIPEIVQDGYQLAKNAFRYNKKLQKALDLFKDEN